MIKEESQPPKPRFGAQWCRLKISKFNKVIVDDDEIVNVIDYDYISYLVNSIDYDYSKNCNRLRLTITITQRTVIGYD